MRSPSKVTISVALGLVFAACSVPLNHTNQEELANLIRDENFLAVHYVMPEPAARSSDPPRLRTPLGGPPQAAGVATLLWLLMYAASKSEPPRAPCLTDPITEVKSRFLSLLQSKAGSATIRARQEPIYDEDFRHLKNLFGNALVIDFKTTHCVLDMQAQGTLNYAARVRLLALKNSTVI